LVAFEKGISSQKGGYEMKDELLEDIHRRAIEIIGVASSLVLKTETLLKL
jgi:hypothetical protein